LMVVCQSDILFALTVVCQSDILFALIVVCQSDILFVLMVVSIRYTFILIVVQASTLTYSVACPCGQLPKKVLVRLNLLVVKHKLIKITKTRE
jgi:hypothetical protein